MFKNLTIKSRLIFVLLFLSAQLLIGALIGIGSLSVANDAMRSMYDNRVVCLDQLDRIVRLLNVNQLNVAQAISASERELDPLMDEVDRNIQTVSKIWGEYTATQLTPEEKRLADSFAEHRGKFVGEGLKPAMAAVRARDLPMAARILHEKMKPLFAPVREDINALISLQLQVARAEYDASQANYRLVRNSCIAGLAIGLALALVAGVLLVRAIVRPLDTAVRVAEAVAGGDLTQRIEADRMDETGRLLLALRKMNDGLVQIVSQVRAGTDAIATGSGQIASGNHDLSSRTEQQASSLEETASSMEELTSTVRQNADNARQANTLAVAASEVAVRGGGVVTQVVGTMEAINESARKIADIIGVIDGIAFQTNILALNAAVEAARAGEQGRGFAVVASEVRSLAQRSANAAREIRTLITDSVEKVEDGSRLVSQAGATMDEIVDSVRRVTDIMGEITAASQEQTAGIEQINQAIAQMDQVTQQNASLVEEAAAASESLQEQAARLAQTVSTFRLDANLVQRASTAPARPASPPAVRQAKQPAPPVPALAGKEEWDEF